MRPPGIDHHQHAQTNRLKALLRDGNDTDRRLARGELTVTVLSELITRRLPRNTSRQQAIRHAEIHRLAAAIRDASRTLKANRAELAAIANDLVPGLTHRPGIV